MAQRLCLPADPAYPFGACTVCVVAGAPCSGRHYPPNSKKEAERLKGLASWGVNPADVMRAYPNGFSVLPQSR